MRWVPHALSLEIRKTLSYRADFWLQLVGQIVTEVGIAYFLWKAIFEAQGAERMGGYDFEGMMLYYLLIPLVGRAVRGDENRFISDEIYEGGLTRYLVYPLPFLGYKYVSLLACTLLGTLQLLLALALFAALFGVPEGVTLGPVSVLQGVGATMAGTALYFLIIAGVEMVSFWQDSVWSLTVMVRFMVMLSGGGMMPLSLFPDWARRLLEALPFSYLISFPIRCFMGEVGVVEWIRSLGVMALWALAFAGVAAWVWRRGTRQYGGVGL